MKASQQLTTGAGEIRHLEFQELLMCQVVKFTAEQKLIQTKPHWVGFKYVQSRQKKKLTCCSQRWCECDVGEFKLFQKIFRPLNHYQSLHLKLIWLFKHIFISNMNTSPILA